MYSGELIYSLRPSTPMIGAERYFPSYSTACPPLQSGALLLLDHYNVLLLCECVCRHNGVATPTPASPALPDKPCSWLAVWLPIQLSIHACLAVITALRGPLDDIASVSS